MADIIRCVGYARFSSHNQREESIEAQVRAIEKFAEDSGYALLKIYADRGISGTTDNRLEFQQMIDDAKRHKFDIVLVHKLDRFARNRTDSAIYRQELFKHNVKLVSVLENFDESPESIILQSVIEGYNEYYSKNLRREVMKGLKENALSCRHTGGTPCLGYDIDKETMKYVINEFEAEAVKLIFKRYLEGEGYTSIIDELNRKGYKTKRGSLFGKNSLYDILSNEKYTGVYVYNKSAAKDANGKFNRHKSKSDDEIIRIDEGVPQIISKEDFQLVKRKMSERRKTAAKYKAKQEYLLSGKIICGECNSSYAGNSRKADSIRPLYISYRCTRKNGSIKCKNPEIRRDVIEDIVLKKLANTVFNEDMLPHILNPYNDFVANKNTELTMSIESTKLKLKETEKGISNVVDVVVKTGSTALVDKLKELEADKVRLEEKLEDAERKRSSLKINKEQLKMAFRKAKQMLKNGSLKNKKAIINEYIHQIVVYRDKVVIEFNISESYIWKKDIPR